MCRKDNVDVRTQEVEAVGRIGYSRLMCNELCEYVNAVFILCQLRVRVPTYTELDSVPRKCNGSETIDETSGQSYKPINE